MPCTAHVSSLRDVDAFFHNHGYANVATLLNTDAIWLDNIYVRLQHPLVRPPPVAACTREDHFFTNCAGGGQFAAWPDSVVVRLPIPGGARASSEQSDEQSHRHLPFSVFLLPGFPVQ